MSRSLSRGLHGAGTLPEQAFTEAWLVVGGRGGKSLVLAMVAIFLALFRDWSANLVPGERGTVLVLAADRRQAQSIMRYATALCTEVPLLAARVERATTEEIDFRGREGIEVATASYRTVRGRTLIAGLLDELAFFRSEDSVNPDFEILDAIRPAMASMPGSMFEAICSPSLSIPRSRQITMAASGNCGPQRPTERSLVASAPAGVPISVRRRSIRRWHRITT